VIRPIWSNVLLAFWSILLIHENLVKAASHLNTALGASFYLAKVWWIIAANSAAVFFSFAGVGLARPWAYSNPPTQPSGFFLRWATLPL
jgi:hypothetical protein